MRMDSYTRFKKSEIVKQCLFAEMEGRPLPVSLDGKSSPLVRKEGGGVNGVVGSGGKKKVSFFSVCVCVQTVIEYVIFYYL